MLLSFLAAASGPAAHAAEVQFDGFYRARTRFFDSLSLDRELANSDGRAMYFQHRLWLKPKFLLSEHAAMFAEIKGFDGMSFGRQPNTYFDVLTQTDVPTAFVDDLSAPTSSTDEKTPLLDVTLWRAWGEVHSPIGRFSFGRMPLSWGLGIWQNDGLGRYGQYGDTADRLQWELLAKDTVFVRAAVDVNAEGFVNQTDDTTSYNGAVAYRSEAVTGGVNLQLRRAPSQGLNLFTSSLQADAEMGPIELHGEGVGQFGGADELENGFNDVQITAFGAVVQAKLDVEPWYFGVEGGFASGDGNLNDAKLKTFVFDRDYDVGLMLFEQAMPTLAAAVPTDLNGGRSLDAALSGNSVANALYLRPTAGRTIVDSFSVEIAALLARTAKMPETVLVDRKKYGMEFSLRTNWTPYDHVDLGSGLGVFLPGTYYRNYSDDTFEGFSDVAFGAHLSARIHF